MKQIRDFMQGIDGTQYFEYDDNTTAVVRMDAIASAIQEQFQPANPVTIESVPGINITWSSGLTNAYATPTNVSFQLPFLLNFTT